ncbi:hypothetical protein F4810DRAFT_26087 [Camillea tinctor]|nr:hypothetical protein F4810DRAFT_26087 [Camillea tinctor]
MPFSSDEENRSEISSLTDLSSEPPLRKDESSKTKVSDWCIICDQKAELRCPTCGTWYCDSDCQRLDWHEHKILCKRLKEEDLARKPHHIRAILFPVDEPQPRFVWLDRRSLIGSVFTILGLDEDIPSRNVVWSTVDGSRRQKRRIRSDSFICLVNPSGVDKINQSIMKLTKPGHARIIFNDALYFCYTGANMIGLDLAAIETYINCVDITMKDYRDIIDDHKHTALNPCLVEPTRFPFEDYARGDQKASIWPAVKVNCDGDIERLSPFYGEGKMLPLVENVQILSAIGQEQRTPSLLPRLAGLPWCSYQIRQCHETLPIPLLSNYGGRLFGSGWKAAGPGNTDVDTTASATSCGCIIVLHETGETIYSSHVLCFFDFAEVQFREMTGTAKQMMGPGMHRIFTTVEQLANCFTKERFLDYWKEWVKDKSRDSEFYIEHTNIRSPYDFKGLDKDYQTFMDIMDGVDDAINEKQRAIEMERAKRDLGLL